MISDTNMRWDIEGMIRDAIRDKVDYRTVRSLESDIRSLKNDIIEIKRTINSLRILINEINE